jgi:myo-inositol-1-phosphate synthase
MPDSAKTGVWLVGARGSVATTAVVGAAAVAAGLVPPTGMVTGAPPVAGAALPSLESLVFGGHDVVSTPLVKRAEALAADGVFPAQLVATVADRLVSADGEIVVMPSPGDDIAPGDAVDRIAGDLLAFRQRHGLESMVVVNLASTEPPALWSEPPADRMALDEVVASGWDACPASVVAAIAALETGCAFVDFTPAVATTVPALTAMAVERRIPFVGRDGKTGETLLKTALAPMFADRSLRVLSWAGTNLLGGESVCQPSPNTRSTTVLASFSSFCTLGWPGIPLV